MARAGLKHWMLHNDQLASELDDTLKLSPGYDPVRDADPALTFHAPLLTGPDSIPGAIRAIFERNSHATYRAPRGTFLLPIGDDESRHEYTRNDEPLGVLMEPASTNKCENYNARPFDTSGWSQQGDPAAVFSIVDGDLTLDNRAGSSSAFVVADGDVGNVNPHAISAYMRGTGTGHLGLSAVTQGPYFELPAEYERIVFILTPAGTTNSLAVYAGAGSLVQFKLHQLEEQAVETSAIVIEGAATSRAIDQLSWPLASAPYGQDKKLDDSDQQGIITNATFPWYSVENQGFYSISDSLITRTATETWEAIRQDVSLEIGAWYRLEIQVFDTNDGELILYIGNEDLAINATAGVHYFLAVADVSRIQIGSAFWTGTLRVSFVKQASPILNQSEGMGALIYQPKAGFEAQGSNNTRHLTLGPSASGNAWISHGWDTNVGQLTDGVETVSTSQSYEADDQIVIAWRWGGGTMSISSKRRGVWTAWNSEPYSGSFQIDDALRLAVGSRFPRNYRDLRIWSVDRGEGWLEDLFEGVAN